MKGGFFCTKDPPTASTFHSSGWQSSADVHKMRPGQALVKLEVGCIILNISTSPRHRRDRKGLSEFIFCFVIVAGFRW